MVALELHRRGYSIGALQRNCTIPVYARIGLEIRPRVRAVFRVIRYALYVWLRMLCNSGRMGHTKPQSPTNTLAQNVWRDTPTAIVLPLVQDDSSLSPKGDERITNPTTAKIQEYVHGYSCMRLDANFIVSNQTRFQGLHSRCCEERHSTEDMAEGGASIVQYELLNSRYNLLHIIPVLRWTPSVDVFSPLPVTPHGGT